MKVTDLCVFEEDGVMFLSFSCMNQQKHNTGRQVFDDLSKLSVNTDKNGWRDISRFFDVKFDEENHKVFVREKNTPVGPYGKASVLKAFPAELCRRGIIDQEQQRVLDLIIAKAKPVVDRENGHTKPDYMSLGPRP